MNSKINLRGSYIGAGFFAVLSCLPWKSVQASDGTGIFNWFLDRPELILALVLAVIFAGLLLLALAAYPRWRELYQTKPLALFSATLVGAVLGVLLSVLIVNSWINLPYNPSAGGASVNLAWNASPSANAAGYIVAYGQNSVNYTAVVDVGNSTAYTVTGLQEGTKYYFVVKAYNSARTIESAYSNEVNLTIPVAAIITADFTTSAKTGVASFVTNFTPVTTGVVTNWTWSLPGSSTPTVTTSTAQVISAIYSNPGTYSVSLTATGPNGSDTKIYPNLITVIAPPIPTPIPTIPPVIAPPSVSETSLIGLVAAYGFEELSGATVADASGKGNHGSIKEAVSITTGHSGRALKFDGINDWITVNDSNSLDLSTGMTLEAWVYPTATMTDWKTVMMKEQPGQQAYTLYANTNSNQPALAPFIGSEQIFSGGTSLLPNQWWHLVGTYDGQNLILYINGKQVAIKAQSGTILTSTEPLHIGGDSIWGEYFQGYIDEVRLYNRALTLAEINYNMATAVSVSNPSQFIMGDKTVEPALAYKPQGTAQAYKATPQKTGVVTSVQVYLDAGSTATELVAGIYKDSKGHPGALVAQGKLSLLKSGAWNSVPIPVASVTAAQPYWVAVLGSKGQVGFRNVIGSASGLIETSASTKLTTLPSTWTRSAIQANSAMSVYGLGY